MLGDDLSVWFSKFHDFSMTFDDFSNFQDFPGLFQKILFFQVFQTLWEPCQMNHLEWKFINFDKDFTAVCSQGPNQQYCSIGSDNGLALSKRQAIILTNDGWFTDA